MSIINIIIVSFIVSMIYLLFIAPKRANKEVMRKSESRQNTVLEAPIKESEQKRRLNQL